MNLGPVQPIEAIRLLLTLFLAGFFARRWELLRQTSATVFRNRTLPSWIGMPKLDYVLPVVAGVAAALLMLFLQKDLGPALFLSCVFLALYAVARGRWPMACVGVATLVASFYLAYQWELSRTLAGRVAMWRSPWNNAAAGGDQVSQALWALATGGVFGTGLGLGETRFIPAGHTDLILAAAGEELGFGGLLAIAAVFATIAWRGFRAARDAKRRSRLLPRHGVDVVPRGAGAGDGRRDPGRDAVDRRGDAVPELWRLGDGSELHGAGPAGGVAAIRGDDGRGRLEGAVPPAAGPARRHAGSRRRGADAHVGRGAGGESGRVRRARRIWDGRRTASAATNTTRASSPYCARCRAVRSTTAPA